MTSPCFRRPRHLTSHLTTPLFLPDVFAEEFHYRRFPRLDPKLFTSQLRSSLLSSTSPSLPLAFESPSTIPPPSNLPAIIVHSLYLRCVAAVCYDLKIRGPIEKALLVLDSAIQAKRVGIPDFESVALLLRVALFLSIQPLSAAAVATQTTAATPTSTLLSIDRLMNLLPQICGTSASSLQRSPLHLMQQSSALLARFCSPPITAASISSTLSLAPSLAAATVSPLLTDLDAVHQVFSMCTTTYPQSPMLQKLIATWSSTSSSTSTSTPSSPQLGNRSRNPSISVSSAASLGSPSSNPDTAVVTPIAVLTSEDAIRQFETAFPGLSIELNTPCIKCQFIWTDTMLRHRWLSAMNAPIAPLQCSCGQSLQPQMTISSKTASSIQCAYLDPRTLFTELLLIIAQRGGSHLTSRDFRSSHAALFWNLAFALTSYKLPIEFIVMPSLPPRPKLKAAVSSSATAPV